MVNCCNVPLNPHQVDQKIDKRMIYERHVILCVKFRSGNRLSIDGVLLRIKKSYPIYNIYYELIYILIVE